jgi:hypothetical protein
MVQGGRDRTIFESAMRTVEHLGQEISTSDEMVKEIKEIYEKTKMPGFFLLFLE